MGKDASEIRHEIERTRLRMGETIEALSYKADVPARARDAVNARVETVKEQVTKAMNGMRTATGQARERMGSTFVDARQRAGEAWNTGTHGVPSGEEMRDAARRGMGIATENPMRLVIGAAAVGFLAGLVLPVTDYERRKVGPIARDAVRAAIDAARHSTKAQARRIARGITRPPEA
jgi:hypothetical protein